MFFCLFFVLVVATRDRGDSKHEIHNFILVMKEELIKMLTSLSINMIPVDHVKYSIYAELKDSSYRSRYILCISI